MKYFIHLPMKMEPIVSSETSAIRTQTPGNYPKGNKLHLEHGESLKTRLYFKCLSTNASYTELLFPIFRNICAHFSILASREVICLGIGKGPVL